MTTSGTVGATVIDVTTIIEHAARRCGVLASSLSSEQQTSAKENLFFVLSDMANRGLSLWCIQKHLLGLALNQTIYNLPIGTVDVINALYRTAAFLGTPASLSATTWGMHTDGENAIATIGVLSATAQTLNLIVDTSDDGITWAPLYAVPGFTTVANLTYWIDIEPTTSAIYWRIRETVLGALTLDDALFGNNTTEVLMSPLNRDDYANYPNKNFAGRPLQYWYDKQYQIPRMWLWPIPNDDTAQMVVWTQRQIQDVGSLTNTLEVPQRWLEAMVFLLASRMAMELPVSTLPPGRMEFLVAMADKYLNEAESSESDGSPIRINPGIRAYTR